MQERLAQREVMCQRVRASTLQSRDRMIAARLCRQIDDVSEAQDQAPDMRAVPLEGGYVYHTFGGVRRNASRLDEKSEMEQVKYDELLVGPRSTWLIVDSQANAGSLDYSSQYLIIKKMQEGM
jgi:hypothetical protein